MRTECLVVWLTAIENKVITIKDCILSMLKYYGSLVKINPTVFYKRNLMCFHHYLSQLSSRYYSSRYRNLRQCWDSKRFYPISIPISRFPWRV